MPSTSLHVVKDNKLIEARLANFKMSASQNRIIAWLASLVHSQKDSDFTTIKTSKNQLNKIIRHNYTRKQLEFELMNLRGATAVIREEKKTIICGIVDVAEYNHANDEIELKLGEKMKPYLLRLGGNQRGFTHYLLDAFLKIRSATSQRIFELMMQWRLLGEVTYSIQDFKKKIKLIEETPKGWVEKYPKWIDFERRVLRQAEKDLFEAGLFMFYYPIKTGKKVTHIRFCMLNNKKCLSEMLESFPSLHAYILSDYERMRIYFTTKKEVIEQAIIDCTKEGNSEPLKKLIPKTRAQFYKRYDQIRAIDEYYEKLHEVFERDTEEQVEAYFNGTSLE